MSFLHATLVGHFELRAALVREKLVVDRPLDPALVERLLAEFGEAVARCVWIEDGCAHCQWAPAAGATERVIEFAERLAREAGAVMMDWNQMLVIHPRDVTVRREP